MKKTAALAITAALAAALLLAGCTPATPAAAPSPTRTVKVQAPPRPTATATAAPIPVTAPTTEAPTLEPEPAPDPWTITEDGLGPFRIGDDETKLLAAGFTTTDPIPGACIQLYSYNSGEARYTHQQEFDVTVGVQNHHIVYAFTTADSPDGNFHDDARAPRTDTGITFGTTFAAVNATFPGIQKITDYGGYREYAIGVNGHYLHVTTTGSLQPVEVVTGLRAANYPSMNIPGC
jgi:hypothetical protein